MKIFNSYITIEDIKKIVSGDFTMDSATQFMNVAELQEATATSICFYENPKYLDDFKHSDAGLFIVPNNFDPSEYGKKNYIKTDKPYLQFMTLVAYWLKKDSSQNISGIDKTAQIHHSVKLGKNITIQKNVVIEKNVEIGDNAFLGHNCVIMKNSTVGKNSKIYPNTTLYEDTIIKNNVLIHSGCVIGSDGFGYLPMNGKQIKIPQIGNVIIEDDVELGANTTIDRATLSSTIIKKGAKIDNLVQVGHNCKVGEDSVLCSQVGLAGHTSLGKRVILAGQVGVAGHLNIGNDAIVGAKSGVSKSLLPNIRYFGIPAIKATDKKRIIVSEKMLPEIARYYRKNLKK